MCPDPQLLSIYMDGELPSPWKEKMEAHLAECPECKKRFDNFKQMQELFKKKTHIKRTIVERNVTVGSEKESGQIDGQESAPGSSITETELLESSKERVWQKLASRQRYTHSGLVRRGGNIRGYSIWRRKISIPIPMAAAAAFIIVFGAMFLMRSNPLNNNNVNQMAEYPNFMFATEDEIPVLQVGMDNMQDINSILQYLDASGADVIILNLPESRNFSRSGEPAIIRAADYSTWR